MEIVGSNLVSSIMRLLARRKNHKLKVDELSPWLKKDIGIESSDSKYIGCDKYKNL
jgi:hypothetical protein